MTARKEYPSGRFGYDKALVLYFRLAADTGWAGGRGRRGHLCPIKHAMSDLHDHRYTNRRKGAIVY